MALRKLRVIVIDDSSLNRRGLADLIASDPELEVVAVASDGEEGLKAALTHRPDAITLDLQMPRVDGFTFLRLLMAKRPTPIVVISSYARKTDAFRALELGAIDFVASPNRPLLPDDPAALELAITLGCTISDNAVVTVVYELASERPEPAFIGRRLALLERVAKQRATPVVQASVAIACALLRDDVVPFGMVRRLDELCRALDRATSRNALALLDMAREFAR
jgi:CheY-like chemotaxis protein